jgi:class 3 adenylate cyclase/uncharacterized protein (DUF427 family)
MGEKIMTDTATDYQIRFEPCRKRLRVEFNGVCIADSMRALVVHESCSQPAYYIPFEDVRLDLLEKTTLMTHCPFKGNASYWTLSADGARADNAAWAYEDPLEDGKALKGYLSFYASKVNAIYEGEQEVASLEQDADNAHFNPMAQWLLREGWKAPAADRLVGEFCECLLQHGVPVARMTVIIPTLHPQVFATVFVWRSDTRQVQTFLEPHDILQQPRFAASPFAPIIRGVGGVRRRLEGNDLKLDFPVVRELHAEGATDYAAMPFRFSDGQINVMSMTSFAKGGFSTAHLGDVHEVLPALGRLFEAYAQRRVAVGLLDTYLGPQTGRLVLEGRIKLGDGQLIPAVIWFCDLRDSTKLAASMSTDAYLAYLNRYFNAMAGAILDCGGEILSYIGDAVLAIFPIGEVRDSSGPEAGAAEPCRRAITAAQQTAERIAATNQAHPDQPPIRYGIGLHIGEVTYGNIGVSRRLQFTVIGPAANEASRIEGMTKDLGERVLVSSKFAASYAGELVNKGRHALKGVAEMHDLFTLPPQFP